MPLLLLCKVYSIITALVMTDIARVVKCDVIPIRPYIRLYCKLHELWMFRKYDLCRLQWLVRVIYGQILIKLLVPQYSSPNIVRVIKSRRMRWAGHVARMEEGRGVHKVLVGKPEGKRPLGRPRRRWDDNIKMDLEEVGRGCGDWMELAQDRKRWQALVSTVMNLRVP